jgi:hypothetical protein
MGRLGEVKAVLQAILNLERTSFVMSESLNVDGGQQATDGEEVLHETGMLRPTSPDRF